MPMFGGTEQEALVNFKKAARHGWLMWQQLQSSCFNGPRIRDDMTHQKAMQSIGVYICVKRGCWWTVGGKTPHLRQIRRGPAAA